MNRREFVQVAALAPAAAQAPAAAFRFVHFTDTHMQPELGAREGIEKAFAAVSAEKPDFALGGGDLLMDLDSCGPDRAKQLWNLYLNARKGLTMPVKEVPGNHDVYGLSPNSKVPANDPQYGKKMFEEKIGPRYQSFDHKGWHFILLDSIGAVGRQFIGEIDEAQLAWLKDDLAKTGPQTPIVVLTHIPLATAMLPFLRQNQPMESLVVKNAREVLEVLSRYNVKAVLQGHTHIREVVHYQGCQYITSGAVSGNWWRGERLGHPEGYAVLTVEGESIRWEYKTYGWRARA